MPDIIEQLEAGKKIQEEQGIDAESLRTKVSSNEEENDTEEKPKKRGRKKKEQPKEEQDNTQGNMPEDPFEQAEQIMGHTKKENKPAEQKPEKYPGFDFNDYYTKGQVIFFVRVHEALGIKEILELKLRTIYPKTIIGSIEKGACQCIGPESKDMIFINRIDAVKAYNDINVKAYKDVNIKEELGDVIINETED